MNSAPVRYWFRWPLSTPPRLVEWSSWHLPLPTRDAPACGALGPIGQAVTQIEKQTFHPPFPRCVDCEDLARRQTPN